VGEERAGRGADALIRLHAIVEGRTEQRFVNDVLASALWESGVIIDARAITTGRRHEQVFRGGFVSYGHIAADLTQWMKQDASDDSWFTTMVDFYRLPMDFPGRADMPSHLPARDRAGRLQDAFAEDIARRLGERPVGRRFVPYIQLHEFEALLFSDPSAFVAAHPDAQRAIAALAAIRSDFATPEEIDEGQNTAPSKRILKEIEEYDKPTSGPLIAGRIGIDRMKQECPHFGAWIERLAALPVSAGT
jgi:hypothetical protein